MKRYIQIASVVTVGILGFFPGAVGAANTPVKPPVVAAPSGPAAPATETVGGVAISTDAVKTTVVLQHIQSAGCSYGQYTQHSVSWVTGLTLGSHTLRTNYCWTGTAISGTPAITIHTVSTTNYGSALGVRLRNDGTTGPSKLSSYQWTTTGYVTYLQCVQGTGACTGGSQHYIIINPQGSGNYGVAAA